MEDPVAWLADVCRQCRLLTETAAIAWIEAIEAEEVGQLAVKPVLEGHYEALRALIPEDFPRSRMGDLARHIHFSDRGDCRDIVVMDVPDVLAKAEEYARSLPTNRAGEVGDFLSPVYRQRFETALAQPEPNFHALVLSCCITLGDLFKRKTGLAEDGDAQLGQAFRAQNPILLVTGGLATEQDRNYQRGAQMLFQGCRAFSRNTHAHEEVATDKQLAVHALMLLSFLTDILATAQVAGEDVQQPH